MKFTVQTNNIRNDLRNVYERFDLRLFKALNFPLIPLKVIRFDGCRAGDITHVKIFHFINWESKNTEFVEQEKEIFFVDQGYRLPFFLKRWQHKHRIMEENPGISSIRDEVEFSSGFLFIDLLILPGLWLTFIYRKPVYRKLLTSSGKKS